MHINSIKNVSFGLIINDDVNNLLARSEKEIAKLGSKEKSLWRRNVKTLPETAPDNYTLFTEDYRKLGEKQPLKIMLQIPNGCKFTLKELFNDEILNRSDIKYIKKQIRAQKKTYEDPHTLYVFF